MHMYIFCTLYTVTLKEIRHFIVVDSLIIVGRLRQGHVFMPASQALFIFQVVP